MTVTVYKSTDASAPVLTGQIGALVGLLDAILVNGYGSKAAQGWSIAFTATNQRAYRMPTGGASNGRYLNVDDTVGAGAANYSRVTGYEAMTAYATGTNPFPSAVQFASGLYCHKSSTADSTARPWFAYGNGKIIYLFIATDSSASNPVMSGFIFGDFTSYLSGDTYNTILIAQTAAAMTFTNAQNMLFGQIMGPTNTGLIGHYLCRSYTGIGTSIAAQKFTNNNMAGVYTIAANTPFSLGYYATGLTGTTIGSGLPYPNAPDAGLYVERVWVAESSYVRGELPGLWAPLHNTPLNHLDTFSGSGGISSKTFEALRCAQASTSPEIFMETSNTW